MRAARLGSMPAPRVERIRRERERARQHPHKDAGAHVMSHVVKPAASRRSCLRLPDRLRKPADTVVDLRWRERAERQAQEPFAAAFREERETVGEVQPFGGLRPHGCRAHALGQRQRDEEPAVGPRRLRVRHVAIDAGEARIEARARTAPSTARSAEEAAHGGTTRM